MKNKMKYVILGLGILLTVLITAGFMSLQFLLRNQSVVTSAQKQENPIQDTTSTIVFIEKIDDYALRGLNLEEDKALTKELKGMQARDKNGNKMPLSQLKAGQIVIIENNVITPSPDVHTINNLTGVKINLDNMVAQVGNTEHRLSNDLLAVDATGKVISLTDLSPYDVVSLNIYKDKVWSITREKESARLILKDLPKDSGQIAIDNSRLLQLKNATNGIPITAGEHKIVLKILGYIPLSIHIVVEAGEDYILSLSDAQMAYTILKPQLNVSNYEVTVANTTYGPNDEIKLPHGQYTVTVQSAGYKTWQGNLELSKDIYLLRIHLIKLEAETSEENVVTEEDIEIPSASNGTTDFLADSITSNSSSNTSTNTSTNTNSSSDTSMEAGTIDIPPSTTPNEQRTITLSTSPSGASIYQGETLIGISPYTLQLNDGTHTFTIQKEGYAPYEAKVTLDSTDEGGIYLYKLKALAETNEEIE